LALVLHYLLSISRNKAASGNKGEEMKYRSMFEKNTGRKYILVGGNRVYEDEQPAEYKRMHCLWRKNIARKARDQTMRDLGLTKVRGSVSGKTYWE
jgi:hypothetical protein